MPFCFHIVLLVFTFQTDVTCTHKQLHQQVFFSVTLYMNVSAA